MRHSIVLLLILLVSTEAVLAQNGTYKVTNLNYFKQRASYRLVDEAIEPKMIMAYQLHLDRDTGMPSIMAEMPDDGTYQPQSADELAQLRSLLIQMVETAMSHTAPVIPHSVVISDSSMVILNAQGDTLQHYAVVRTEHRDEKTHFTTSDGRTFYMKHLTEYTTKTVYRLTIDEEYYELTPSKQED